MMPPELLYVGEKKDVYEDARRLAGCISGSSWVPKKGYVAPWHGCHSWLIGSQLFEEDRKFADFSKLLVKPLICSHGGSRSQVAMARMCWTPPRRGAIVIGPCGCNSGTREACTEAG